MHCFDECVFASLTRISIGYRKRQGRLTKCGVEVGHWNTSDTSSSLTVIFARTRGPGLAPAIPWNEKVVRLQSDNCEGKTFNCDVQLGTSGGSFRKILLPTGWRADVRGNSDLPKPHLPSPQPSEKEEKDRTHELAARWCESCHPSKAKEGKEFPIRTIPTSFFACPTVCHALLFVSDVYRSFFADVQYTY